MAPSPGPRRSLRRAFGQSALAPGLGTSTGLVPTGVHPKTVRTRCRSLGLGLAALTLRGMAGIYPACIADIQRLERVGNPGGDGLEQEPDVVAERITLEDPARASHGAIGEEWLATGPRFPSALRELVDVIAGFAAKQLGEIRTLGGYEMHTQMRGVECGGKGRVLHRQTHQQTRWVDTRLRGESDEAPVARLGTSCGDDERCTRYCTGDRWNSADMRHRA